MKNAETRTSYVHFTQLDTRWNDNDVYGHVNNVDYYAFFDTVINAYLIEEGGLDIHRGATIGLFAEGAAEPAASGWFVHVFVDRETRRPAEIPGPLRAALERLVVAPTD